jgi:hypothetical protein
MENEVSYLHKMSTDKHKSCFTQCICAWHECMNDKWHFIKNSWTLCVSCKVRERSGPYANIQSQSDEISFVVWGGLFMQMVDLRVSYINCWLLRIVQLYIK